jgi:hypothetical protein
MPLWLVEIGRVKLYIVTYLYLHQVNVLFYHNMQKTKVKCASLP